MTTRELGTTPDLITWRPRAGLTTTKPPTQLVDDLPKSTNDSPKQKLSELRRMIKTEMKKFELLAQRKTRTQLRLQELRRRFREIDYELAQLDGRLTICPPVKTPVTRCRLSEKPKKSNTETAKEALALMSVKDREELLKSLLE